MVVDPQEGLQPPPLHLGGRAPRVIPWGEGGGGVG